MYYQTLLDKFTHAVKEITGEKLTGIYLHGSLAMGCFHPEKSDIDLIVVVSENLSDDQKGLLMQNIVLLNKEAPAKGLEISVVKKEFCKPFVYPTPFELHFSRDHLQRYLNNPADYIEKMHGVDKDLAAHLPSSTTMELYCGEKRLKTFSPKFPNRITRTVFTAISKMRRRIF